MLSARAALLERAYGTRPRHGPMTPWASRTRLRSQLLKAGKPAYVPETFVDFGHARRLILALGGIPVYPTLADGVQPLTQYEDPVETLIADLKARGIPAAEFIPVRNTPDVLARYVRAMRAAGLFVTAGTEHNTLDLLPLAPTCVGRRPDPGRRSRHLLGGRLRGRRAPVPDPERSAGVRGRRRAAEPGVPRR